tara:strand:- start:165 stop:425 length:261 start_codon:yes stop_codon:yes gene_type:complete
MADTYAQPRPAQNSDDTKTKVQKTMNLAEKAYGVGAAMILGAGAYGAYEGIKINKFRNQQDNLRRKEHMKRFLETKRSRRPDMIVD